MHGTTSALGALTLVKDNSFEEASLYKRDSNANRLCGPHITTSMATSGLYGILDHHSTIRLHYDELIKLEPISNTENLDPIETLVRRKRSKKKKSDAVRWTSTLMSPNWSR